MKDISLKPPKRKGIKDEVREGKDLRLHLSDRELLHREPHINLLGQERKYHISVQSSIYHHGYAVKNDPTIEVNGFKGCSFVALYLPIKQRSSGHSHNK